MKATNKLFAILLLGLNSSCAERDIEESGRSLSPDSLVKIPVEASLGVDYDAMKNLNLEVAMGERQDGTTYVVPKLKLEHNQEIPVVTVIQSSDGLIGADVLTWTYKVDKSGDRTKDRLVIGKGYDGKEGAIYMSADYESKGHQPSTTRKWYIWAIIGARLEKNSRSSSSYPSHTSDGIRIVGDTIYKVSLEPTPDLEPLRSVSHNGQKLLNINLPYSTGWTEYKIPQRGEPGRSATGGGTVKFKPYGSVLAIRVKNTQSAGRFTPKGLYIRTDKFSSQNKWLNSSLSGVLNSEIGHFPNMNNTTPYNLAAGHFEMKYKLVGARELGLDDVSDYYLAVVFPLRGSIGYESLLQIMVEGESSYIDNRPMNMWFSSFRLTDPYKPLQHGKVYTITANLTDVCLRHPLQYVAESNLAGSTASSTMLAYPIIMRPWSLPIRHYGSTGNLRWAYDNPNPVTETNYFYSGYYNWYIATGTYHSRYNPKSVNIFDQHIAGRALKEDYYLPSVEDWASVLPGLSNEKITWEDSHKGNRFYWRIDEGNNTTIPDNESYRIAGGTPFSYRLTTSSVYTPPINGEDGKIYVYAIKHLTRSDQGAITYHSTFGFTNDEIRLEAKANYYPEQAIAIFGSIYRYALVGDHVTLKTNNRLEIEAIHLGHDAVREYYRKISENTIRYVDLHDQWESLKAKYYYVGKRILPSGGKVIPNGTNPFGSSGQYVPNGTNVTPGWGAYWSATKYREDETVDRGHFVMWSHKETTVEANQQAENGMHIRPFLRCVVPTNQMLGEHRATIKDFRPGVKL